MLLELKEMRTYLTALRDMTPERAQRWVQEEHLFQVLLGSLDRLEQAVAETVGHDHEEIEHLEIRLNARHSVPDEIGRTNARTLAGFIRHLPLKDGYVVSIAEWSDGRNEILVHHVGSTERRIYDKVSRADKIFQETATGPGSFLQIILD